MPRPVVRSGNTKTSQSSFHDEDHWSHVYRDELLHENIKLPRNMLANIAQGARRSVIIAFMINTWHPWHSRS